jgi:glycerophosphoryl diester phosphodiesterase
MTSAMRLRFLPGFVVALGLALGVAVGTVPLRAAPPRAETLRAALLHGSHSEIFLVAHRGDWRNFPENSLAAIEGSIAESLEMAEIDLQRTKDGHLILMHDPSVDRTTTGKGNVSDLTLEDIRSLRLRDGLGSPTSFSVPTLREALVVARGRILLNLDKGYRHFREVMPLLEETNTLGLVLLKGPLSVEEVITDQGDLLSRVAYMPVINFGKPGAADRLQGWLEKAKPCAVEFVFTTWSTELAEAFAECRRQGVRIWVNVLWPHLAGGLSDDLALDKPDEVYGVLLDRGVSILQTDRPRELQAYLRQRGRRSQ